MLTGSIFGAFIILIGVCLCKEITVLVAVLREESSKLPK
jgi:hypothetical protein